MVATHELLAGLASFDTNPDSDGADSHSYLYSYWRKPNGYIVDAPSWPTEHRSQTRQGWRELDHYGFFLRNNPDEPGGAWRTAAEPYRRILLNGGAGEFSVDEILEHGWHRRPPYRGVAFPNVKKDTDGRTWVNRDPDLRDAAWEMLVEYECAPCKRWFLSEGNLSTHQAVAHNKESGNQALGRDIAKATQGLNEPMAKLIDKLSERIEHAEAQADARAKATEERIAASEARTAEALTALAQVLVGLKG